MEIISPPNECNIFAFCSSLPMIQCARREGKPAPGGRDGRPGAKRPRNAPDTKRSAEKFRASFAVTSFADWFQRLYLPALQR